jgi:hypothetical protein
MLCRSSLAARLARVLLALLVINVAKADWDLAQATLLGHSYAFSTNLAPFRWPLGCQGQQRLLLQLSFSAGGEQPSAALVRCAARLSVACADDNCQSAWPVLEAQVRVWVARAGSLAPPWLPRQVAGPGCMTGLRVHDRWSAGQLRRAPA